MKKYEINISKISNISKINLSSFRNADFVQKTLSFETRKLRARPKRTARTPSAPQTPKKIGTIPRRRIGDFRKSSGWPTGTRAAHETSAERAAATIVPNPKVDRVRAPSRVDLRRAPRATHVQGWPAENIFDSRTRQLRGRRDAARRGAAGARAAERGKGETR